jgi:hypothetical protein
MVPVWSCTATILAPASAKSSAATEPAAQVHAQPARRLAPGDEHAAAGGLDAAERSAQVQRLARDHAGGGAADVHRVGVHHPRHDLRVGIHVRRGNIGVRADDDADLAGVAARDLLEFLQRELLRVDADAALGAAVRQVDGRGLDGHPGRQRHHFFQRDVGVEAHATLARAAAHVVLHAVALEVGDGAVVHLDRHVDDQRALGALECFDPAGQRAEVGHHAVDLREVGAPGAVGGRMDEGELFTHGRSLGLNGWP